MSRIQEAAEILSRECDEARRECDAEPGNIHLAMRLSRLQVISSMVQTFGLGAGIASGHLPVEFEPATDMDGRSSAGDELAGSGCSVTVTDACASERGRPKTNDLSC